LNLFERAQKKRRWSAAVLARRASLGVLFAFVFIYIKIASRGKWSAWPRNSIAMGYWSENSDLDLSLYCVKNIPLPLSIRALWKFCRRFGEWAAYTSEDREIARLANPFELERDPRLKSALEISSRHSNPVDAFVYWTRMSESDGYLHEQKTRISSRARKWHFHLSQVRQHLKDKRKTRHFPEFIEEVRKELSPFRIDTHEHRAFLRPHHWLNEALSSGQQIEGHFADAAPLSLELARAQVRWEAWGVLGQLRLRKNYSEVARHLQHLANLFAAGDQIKNNGEQFQQHIQNLEARESIHQ
jgi:hypothetical protein